MRLWFVLIGAVLANTSARAEPEAEAEPTASLLAARAELHISRGERRIAADLLTRAAETPGVDESLAETMLQRAIALHEVPSQLSLELEPAGAQVRIDGEEVGQGSLVRLLPAGSHDLQVTAPGYRMRRTRITLEYGEPICIALQLKPTEVASPTPKVPVASAEASSSTPGVQSARAWHVTVGSRWSVVPEAREGHWFAAFVGLRTLSDRVEVQALGGELGATLGRGFGAVARGYLTTGRIAPFVTGAALFAEARGWEIGGGVISKLGDSADGQIGFEAVLQVELLTIRHASPMDVGPGRVVVPVTLGLAARL